jgi:hypothetical protein
MMIYTAASVRDVSVDAGALAGLTWTGHAFWYADPVREQVVCVDPRTSAAGAAIACPGLRAGLTTVDENLLYAATEDHLLHIRDTGGEEVGVLPNPRPGLPITGMEATRDGVWLGYPDTLELRRINDLALIAKVPAPLGVNGITVTDRYLIHTDCLGEAITVYDLWTMRTVLRIQVDGRPTSLGWDGLRLWYCDAANLRLRALDVPGLSTTV